MNKKWILPIVFVFLTAGCGEKEVVNEQLAEQVSEKPVNLLRLDDFKQVMQEEGTLLSSKGEGTHEMFILSGEKPSIFTASLMFHEEVNPKKNLYVYEFKSDEERKIGLEAFDQIKDIVKFSAQPQVTFQKNLAVIYWSDAQDLEPNDNVVTDPVGESVLYAMDRLGEPGIEGYIVDKKAGEILVVSSKAVDYSHGKGQEFYNAIWFSNVSDTLVIGDKVKVWAERGNYTLPYPGREIAHKVIEQTTVRPKGADRTEEYMLQRALQDEKLKTDMHKIIAVKSVNYNAKEDTWYLHFKDTIMLEDFYFKLDDK